jgi:hypothetical protein
MVSMSTGDLKVEGNHASYELRMPMYEIAHVRKPERTSARPNINSRRP